MQIKWTSHHQGDFDKYKRLCVQTFMTLKMKYYYGQKILNWFSGPFFEKQMRRGEVLFLFIKTTTKKKKRKRKKKESKKTTNAGTFFSKLERYLFKSWALTVMFIKYYSNQVIKLYSKSLCTSRRFDFIIDA